MRQSRFWLPVLLLLVAAVSAPQTSMARVDHPQGQETEGNTGLEWSEGFTLVVTDAEDIQEAWAIENAIQEAGGHIGLIFGDKVMMGWMPQEVAADLVGKEKIAHVSRRPLWSQARGSLDMRQTLSQDEVDGIRFFNKVASGKLAARRAAEKNVASRSGTAGTGTMRPDALEAPPLNYEDYRRNLLANGITEETLADAGISIVETDEGVFAPSPGNSDYLAGKATLNVFFVESVGGVDPNLYSWNTAAKDTIKAEIASGLAWLANTAKNANTYKVPLVFNLRFQTGNTNYEPILHSSSQDYLWIEQIMASMGYGTGDKFTRTTAFNTAERILRNTNWAATSFVGYNPSPAPSTFTNGYFAYAYSRGPYSQLLYRNNGWAIGDYDKVNVHESGHLFAGAPDEYYVAGYGGCTSVGRSTNNVYNGNCEYLQPNAISCMMRNNAWSLCGYTPGHFGWQGATDLKVATYRVDNGVAKLYFAPGEAIQYKTNFCIAGPRIGTEVHTVRIRYRAEYFTSGLDTSGAVADDTGWGSWTGPTPPVSTGKTCWVTWWNRSVPATATYGQATLTVQMEVEGMHREAKPKTSMFYVINGAATTEPAPLALSGPASNFETIDEGPFFEFVGEEIE